MVSAFSLILPEALHISNTNVSNKAGFARLCIACVCAFMCDGGTEWGVELLVHSRGAGGKFFIAPCLVAG